MTTIPPITTPAETVSDPATVAAWMAEQLRIKNGLSHRTVIAYIRHEFGGEHLYVNANGNVAISKDVLIEFHHLAGGSVVWNGAKRYWRIRRRPRTNTGPSTP